MEAKLKITAVQMQQYLDVQAERKELQRKADALYSREQALKEHFREYLDAHNQRQANRTAGGFVFTAKLGTKKGRVSWKDVVVEKLGALFAAKRAEEEPDVVTVTVEKKPA